MLWCKPSCLEYRCVERVCVCVCACTDAPVWTDFPQCVTNKMNCLSHEVRPSFFRRNYRVEKRNGILKDPLTSFESYAYTNNLAQGEERILIDMIDLGKKVFLYRSFRNTLFSIIVAFSVTVLYLKQLTWNHLQLFTGEHEEMDMMFSHDTSHFLTTCLV